jgi:hypothetical protein
MDILRTIYKLLGWQFALNEVPFEELAERFAGEPHEVSREFVRRLKGLVWYAAEDYLRRSHQPVMQEDVDENMNQVFREFFPQFGAGDPTTLLLRFAEAIRNVLDAAAFKMIAHRYYYLLPIYHLKDDEQRRLLSAFFQNGLGTRVGSDFAEDLAEEFHMPVEKVVKVLRLGATELQRIIKNDFTPTELNELTEGYLP